MSPLQQLDDEATRATAHILQLTGEDGGTVVHDFSDPLDVAYLDQLAIRTGFTPDRYPALFDRIGLRPDAAPIDRAAALEAQLADTVPGAFQDGQNVDFIGTLESAPGIAKGRATFTRVKPIASATVWLDVVNVTGGVTTSVATGAAQLNNAQTTPVQTDDGTAGALPSTGTNYGVISWSVQYADGTYESNSGSTPWAYNAARDPIISAPKQRPNRTTGNLSAIVVGLSRGIVASDIDYQYWQGQASNLTLMVPLAGSVQFNAPIAPLSTSNPAPEFYLSRREGGMSELKAANVAQYLPRFNISPTDPTVLQFDMGVTNPAQSINFGQSPWVSDTTTFFTAIIKVTLAAPRFVGWSSVVSSLNPDRDPTDGVLFIKPVVFVWHCLVAGTRITMADRTTQAIETLDQGAMVKSGNGQRAVLATLAQPHWGPVVIVQLNQSANITCSGTHPFITPNGPVMAAQLQPGTPVFTSTGRDVVAAVTPSSLTGQVLYNLWLDPGPAGATTMYANDVAVGDYLMQVDLVGESRENPELVRAALPPELHRDYESYLEDRQVTV